VTYKVPPTYGGKMGALTGDREVHLGPARQLCEEYRGRLRVYPGSLELREGKTYALTSRTVAVVGIADAVQDARRISLEGIRSITGGALWHRRDIASEANIARSVDHMTKLRKQ
jgi:phosphoribosylamine-glycine ligase